MKIISYSISRPEREILILSRSGLTLFCSFTTGIMIDSPLFIPFDIF